MMVAPRCRITRACTGSAGGTVWVARASCPCCGDAAGELAKRQGHPAARTDEGKIRATAVSHGVPCITTIQAAEAAVRAMEAMREEEMTVQAVQDRFPSNSP